MKYNYNSTRTDYIPNAGCSKLGTYVGITRYDLNDLCQWLHIFDYWNYVISIRFRIVVNRCVIVYIFRINVDRAARGAAGTLVHRGSIYRLNLEVMKLN